MSEPHGEILRTILTTIEDMKGDWEFDTDLSGDTRLLRDLNMKSLDLVVLCTRLVRKYGVMPLDELYARLGTMPPETRELTLGELVDFVEEHVTVRVS
ncbi:hypothetical protein [Smaragdicoccus niigatensis]|uniref:hypothetical protein n=1 Tax=Smaragdicoccus niigatensis TaxID=359359 RepID=UPI0003735C16|nr:hypothetical protein [Smaragdicoccus niigatensis]